MVSTYHWVLDGEAPFDHITAVLDYLWDEELKSYETSGEWGHIFLSLAGIANWLNSGANWSATDYVKACNAGVGSRWRVSATHKRPDTWTPPATKRHRKTRTDSLNGETVDVTEEAKAAGFGRSVAVSVQAWRSLITGEGTFGFENEDESLAELLRIVAAAYRDDKDVYTWFYGADYGAGAGEDSVITVKALHQLNSDEAARLTVKLSWEDEV